MKSLIVSTRKGGVLRSASSLLIVAALVAGVLATAFVPAHGVGSGWTLCALLNVNTCYTTFSGGVTVGDYIVVEVSGYEASGGHNCPDGVPYTGNPTLYPAGTFAEASDNQSTSYVVVNQASSGFGGVSGGFPVACSYAATVVGVTTVAHGLGITVTVYPDWNGQAEIWDVPHSVCTTQACALTYVGTAPTGVTTTATTTATATQTLTTTTLTTTFSTTVVNGTTTYFVRTSVTSEVGLASNPNPWALYFSANGVMTYFEGWGFDANTAGWIATLAMMFIFLAITVAIMSKASQGHPISPVVMLVPILASFFIAAGIGWIGGVVATLILLGLAGIGALGLKSHI